MDDARLNALWNVSFKSIYKPVFIYQGLMCLISIERIFFENGRPVENIINALLKLHFTSSSISTFQPLPPPPGSERELLSLILPVFQEIIYINEDSLYSV